MVGGNNPVYGQTRASIIEQNTYDPSILANRIVEFPSNLQQRIDYDTRTDGQPVYMGFAEKGLGISASGWLLQKYTYNVSAQMTVRQVAYDSWDDRGLTTYA